MYLTNKTLITTLFLLLVIGVAGQDIKKDNEIHFTTGAGVNLIQGSLKKTFQPTVAFSSGFEKGFGGNWFAQLDLNFNTLKYDQQEKDVNSDYLFQNTSSSLFMIGLNGGYDFHFGRSRWFASPFAGSGYINIGEPRLRVHQPTGIITQDIIRQGGIVGKTGARIGFDTRSRFLQILYLESSYWTSSLKINQQRVSGISVFGGIRMAM